MPAPRRISFLLNPRSGGRRGAAVVKKLSELAQEHDSNLDLQFIDRSNLRSQIARAKLSDILVVGGGDGTVSTLLEDLATSEITIGLLPLGTGNDLARELGVYDIFRQNDVIKLLEFYRSASVREVTVYRLEYGEQFSQHTLFLNYASFGFDAKVVSDFANWRKTRMARLLRGVWTNRIAYAAIALLNLRHKLNSAATLKVLSADSADSIEPCSSLIFANIRSIFGMGITSRSGSVFDDRIECIVAPNPLAYFSMACRLKFPFSMPRMLGSQPTWELEGLPHGTFVQVDGEPRPDISASKYRVRVSRKLKVLVGSC